PGGGLRPNRTHHFPQVRTDRPGRVTFELNGPPFAALNGGPMFSVLPELITGPDTAKSQRSAQAMLKMKKLDIDELSGLMLDSTWNARNSAAHRASFQT
ncbi:MAG: hypothetical protein WBP86_14360, partial [Thiobacillaceae bacterium]